MITLELDELRDLIRNEGDAKTKGTLMVLLCIADRVSDNTDSLKIVDVKLIAHDEYIVKYESYFSISVWVLGILQVIVIGVFAYIFEDLNTISFKQAGILSTVEYIKFGYNEIDQQLKKTIGVVGDSNARLQNIENRNEASDNLQRDIKKNLDRLP